MEKLQEIIMNLILIGSLCIIAIVGFQLVFRLFLVINGVIR